MNFDINFGSLTPTVYFCYHLTSYFVCHLPSIIHLSFIHFVLASLCSHCIIQFCLLQFIISIGLLLYCKFTYIYSFSNVVAHCFGSVLFCSFPCQCISSTKCKFCASLKYNVVSEKLRKCIFSETYSIRTCTFSVILSSRKFLYLQTVIMCFHHHLAACMRLTMATVLLQTSGFISSAMQELTSTGYLV